MSVTRVKPKLLASNGRSQLKTAVSPEATASSGRLSAAHGAAPFVQMKVAIGGSDDVYEQEANRVADHVVAGQVAPPIAPIAPGGLGAAAQRQTVDEEEPVQLMGEEEEPIQLQEDDEEAVQLMGAEEEESVQLQEDDEESVQLKDGSGSGAGSNGGGVGMQAAASHAIQHKGSGQPLPSSTRGRLESSMGSNLGQVRVHNDGMAQQTNKQLKARAFTHDNHIWLGRGESSNDLRLMAHETTHVLQQGGVVRRQTVQEEEEVGETAVTPTPTLNGTSTATTPLTEDVTLAENQSETVEVEEETEAVEDEAVAEAEEGVGEGGGEGEETAVTEAAPAESSDVELVMPPPPDQLTEPAQARLAHSQRRADSAAATQSDLPTAVENTGGARAAVEEPVAETAARAQSNLVAALEERIDPSPEIEKLCEDIYEVIRSKRPPDEDSLVDADPEEMANEAGGQLNQSIEGDAARVEGEYNELDTPPEGTPEQLPEEINAPPETVASPAPNAVGAAPDPIPAEDLSLAGDVEATQQRIDDAGMNTEVAQEIQEGPVAEARETQSELDESSAQAHAEMIAEQEGAIASSQADMAALQQAALQSLSTSRSGAVNATGGQQGEMVGSEQVTREQVSRQAEALFSSAQQRVNALLAPLSRTAMQRWETGKTSLAQQFKDHLKEVDDWIEERHSGVGGALLGVADYFTGLPDWVIDEYDDAEENFGDGVCALIREISVEVNTIIAACEQIIVDANREIDELFTNLPEDLKTWAEGERGRFQERLDGLNNRVTETRDNFNRDLANRASQAVQDVREQIHARREAAKGLIGKIADAIAEFIEDPVRAIINGLLRLVGIPPATFWAVVNRIGDVISDIADDPLGFAGNLLSAVGQGFQQFFDNIGDHLLKGLVDWLFSGLGSVDVELPTDFSLKSLITFFLQLMGISWPRIRKLLAKHIGEENVALIEKAWEIISTLIEKGPEGIFEMLKEQLDPQQILDMILEAAVDFLTEALIKQVTARIILLFNPVGAIAQAVEAIYRVLKWVFTNAARIFSLIETIVNGMADIVAGNTSGMADAVEKALAGLITPVINFLADYASLGDLPDKIADVIRRMQSWVEGILDRVIGWLAERGKALLKSLGFGDEEEAEEAVDLTDHEAVATRVVNEMEETEESATDYPTLRAKKEQQARQLEERYSAMLEAGIGLSINFADPTTDQTDEDVDFEVLIAPNNTKKLGSSKGGSSDPKLGPGAATKVGDSVRILNENSAVRVTEIMKELEIDEKKSMVIKVEGTGGLSARYLPYDTYGEDWDNPDKPVFVKFSPFGGAGQGGHVRVDSDLMRKGTSANIPKSVRASIDYDPKGSKWKFAGHLVAKVLGGPGGWTSGNIVPMTAKANATGGGMPGIENKIRDDIDINNAVYDYAATPVYNLSQQRPPTEIQVKVTRLYPLPKLPSGVPSDGNVLVNNEP